MHAAPHRTPVSGPTFIRLLARFADTDLAPDAPAPAEQLGFWVDWTRAVSLSRALDGTPEPTGPVRAPVQPGDVARIRAQLAAAIVDDGSLAAAEEFAPFREHCLRQQRGMQSATGRLRGPLRDQVAAAGPALARLAEVDAVMEGVLSPREHALLATVPDLLGKRFEALRQASGAAAGDLLPAVAPGWRDRFRNDMRDVLLAELDLRFQPIEGLLAALRDR